MARWHVEKRTHTDGKTVSYRVKAELPLDASGRRQTKTGTFPTRKEADTAGREWSRDADNGIAVKTVATTVRELSDQWLALVQPTLKPNSYRHYEYTLREHVAAHIGTLPVQKVRPSTIDALYILLREAGLSGNALHRVHQRLRQLFDYAGKRYIVTYNPMLHIDAPPVHSAESTVLTAPQIGRFLAFAQADALAAYWLLVVQTGLRRGEALGVRWQDLDLERGKLSVRQCVEAIDGKPHIQTPKTAAARRTMSLFPESVAALKAHRTGQLQARLRAAEWEDNDLVFCTDRGTPIAPTNALRNLRRICQQANAKAAEDKDEAAVLPHFDIHDLRHTHASHLLREGWDVVRVSRRLGHANPAITMAIYAHLITDERDDAPVTPAALAFAGIA